MKARMTVDVLRNCDPPNLKSSARTVWTNVSVTAALILTVAGSMLQVHNDVDKDLNGLDQAYCVLCYMAVWYSAYAVATALINLIYVEPLTNSDAIKYFIANPNVVGTPTVHTIKAILFMFLAFSLWTLGTLGPPTAIFTFLLLVWFFYFIAMYIKGKQAFDPTGATARSMDWQWVTKERSEWPALAQSRDRESVVIFQKLAKHIDDNEILHDARELEPEYFAGQHPLRSNV